VIDSIPNGIVTSVERETFPALIADNRRIVGYKENAYWLDIGTPSALFKASRDRVMAGFNVHPTAQIDSSALLSGGTFIGAQAVIAAGATLENCIVCPGAQVATGARLERCFLAPGAIVDSDASYQDRYISMEKNLPITFI
jgi:mannose-1-phosphate guanylyltransferase